VAAGGAVRVVRPVPRRDPASTISDVHWDGFAAMERDVRGMAADPRWAELPLPSRAQAMADRVLVTPEGACWVFGAHGRWYRYEPSDGVWHLSAPPVRPDLRAAARPARPAPRVPVSLLPAAADCAADRGSTQAFVGPDVPREITDGIRELISTLRDLRQADFPLDGGPFSDIFAGDVPSTVAVVWGTIMWCAYAPAFDGNEALLTVFGEFLARPLPGDDWIRWLPGTRLDALADLYGERISSGAQVAGLRLAGLMGQTAKVLRSDARFRPRADALLAMVAPNRPWPRGDVRRTWLARVPPHLTAAVIGEHSPGEHFRHVFYDLVESLSYVAATGADPRAVAASLLAADVAAVAPNAVESIYGWLDPQLRNTLYVALADPRHPLRGCWPDEDGLPAPLEPPDRNTAAALLGSAYATGLAWCRLTGTPPPSRGFPVAAAVSRSLLHQRDDPVIDDETRRAGAPTTASWLDHN